MKQFSARDVIDRLELLPHPEGGYFRETYRSQGSIGEGSLPEGMLGYRNYCTAIYFLLTRDQKSHFHRLKSDELWYFHLGSPLEVIFLKNDKTCQHYILGSDIFKGELLQLTIPAGTWFAARCLNDTAADAKDFSLVSCTVSPGFDFLDFELADESLLKELPADPQYAELLITAKQQKIKSS